MKMLKKSEWSVIEWAAIRWWQGYRPYDWNIKKHLLSPTINMSSPREHDLAKAVVEAIRRK